MLAVFAAIETDVRREGHENASEVGSSSRLTNRMPPGFGIMPSLSNPPWSFFHVMALMRIWAGSSTVQPLPNASSNARKS